MTICNINRIYLKSLMGNLLLTRRSDNTTTELPKPLDITLQPTFRQLCQEAIATAGMKYAASNSQLNQD